MVSPARQVFLQVELVGLAAAVMVMVVVRVGQELLGKETPEVLVLEAQ